ncbi:MAG: DNA cytosine methyltransferase [Coprobacillus sp.]|nr:DNA cytosine methyltransferase [Coprobacillus sp.]
MKIRVFTSFSGYDSQLLALERLHRNFPEFEYECVGWCEIDKYAIQAHNALFPDLKEKNYGDICAIDWDTVPDFDLFTMSSPCQDFSIAGMRAGGEEGSGTRSSLLWECRRAILAKKPKYILFENVKNLISENFRPYFLKWQAELARYGYDNFAKVLNAKDYGVPQNRERVFMISILDGGSYHFPKKMPLTRVLKDVLEPQVDERYYLSDRLVETFLRKNKLNAERGNGFRFESTEGGASQKQYWQRLNREQKITT